MSPRSGDPFEFRNQTWQVKSYSIGLLLHFSENCMISAQPFCHNTLASQTDDDRRHIMTVAELAMQLQCSAKITYSEAELIDYVYPFFFFVLAVSTV